MVYKIPVTVFGEFMQQQHLFFRLIYFLCAIINNGTVLAQVFANQSFR